MTALVQYDAACAALDAALTADEVMAVHVTAQGVAAVARVANNIDLELKAVKLRTRAELRLGDMIVEGERTGAIAKHGGKRRGRYQDSSGNLERPATLKEIGVKGKLAVRARQVSRIGARAVEALLTRLDEASRKRGRVAVEVINEPLAKRSADSRRNLARELSDCAALQPTGRLFPVAYADPAWRRKAGIGDRAYENHYSTETWDEIIAMPVAKRMLPDGWLFLWIPRAHLLALHPTEIDTPLGRCKVKLPLAYAVAQAWGFDAYSTCFIWTKTDDECPDDHGLGLIAWDQDEILCLFKRGRGLPKPDTEIKFGSNHRERAGSHSAKPTYYRDMINAMSGNVPVLELFAREDDEHPLPPNFYTWGNQSKNTAELPPHDPQTGEIVEQQPVVEATSLPPTADGEKPPEVLSGTASDLPDFLNRNSDASLWLRREI
jgi:N6-adenosine-specific RNA methylase IME4